MKKNTWWKPQNGVIKVCRFCGEQIGNSSTLCSLCKTKDSRKELVKQQLEIEKENGIITETLFGFNRQYLLKEYNL